MQPERIGEIVNQGESAEVMATLYDDDGNVLDKAAIGTLTVTQTLGYSETIINNRQDQDILDNNNGTVASDGMITLKLQPSDTVCLQAPIGDVEPHHLHLEWTWIDLQGDPMTGRHSYRYLVQATTSDDLLPIMSGWPG